MRLRRGPFTHEVARRSESTFAVDGATVSASVRPVGPCRFDGRSPVGRTSVFVAREGDQVFARVGGREYSLRVVARAASTSGGASHERGGLEAPMPGRVTRVHVEVGEAVVRGQELIVIEAMKMENALTAPLNGVVKTMAVKVGDMVVPGTDLVVIEETS